MNSFDLWKPLYLDDFSFDKYLYHYTNIEKAIKIIHSNSLLFSPINKTNDTSESKMRLCFQVSNNTTQEEYTEEVTAITNYFNQYSQVVQLLCFSTDAKINKIQRNKYLASIGEKDKYYDVSGRGFALPRMWAQYAENNEGVCFVFNRAKLLDAVAKRVALYKCDPVAYKMFFDKYIITENQRKTLYNKVSMMVNGGLTLLDMIQNDKDFLKYNFFEKLNDWENEHEYRIIALIDNKTCPEKRLSINKMSSFLEGIVIGEKMDQAYEETIKMLVKSSKNNIEVKRINFDSRICKIK